jgi:hypothetical protein
MRASFRQTDTPWMLLIVVALSALVIVSLVRSNGSQGPVAGTVSIIGLVVAAATIVVRTWRRSIVFDEVGLTKRDMFTTEFVPWSAVDSISFAGDDMCTLRRVDTPRRIKFSARPAGDELPMAEAYLALQGDWKGRSVYARPYPRGSRRLVTYAFIGAVLAALTGALVWEDGRYDDDIYAARDRRDRYGHAVVTRVRVEGEDHAEGETTYTTFVTARLHLPDGHSVVVVAHRPGDVVDRYERGERITVVYDAVNPKDADFADHPTRNAQASSVRVRTITGLVFLIGGIVGLVGFGAAIGRDWTRRLRTAEPQARLVSSRL